MKKLHIFTLSFNGSEKLQKLYKSLIPNLNNLDYKWHIKDNGSSDNSEEVVKQWNNANINFIKYPNNKQNYSEGMNLLYKEANPNDDDLVLSLNNDIIFYKDNSINEMINALTPDVGAVGAKLNFTNTKKIQHAGVLFHPNVKSPFHYRAGQKEESKDTLNRYFPAVTGAVTLTRGEVFRLFKNNSGNFGFNENYIWCFEDIDLMMRVKYHLKKEIVYCGKTGIFHEESATLKTNPMNKLFLKSNLKLFFENWLPNIDVSLYNKYLTDPNFNLVK